MQIDEGILRPPRLRLAGGFAAALIPESLVDHADVEGKPADRAVTEQGEPAFSPVDGFIDDLLRAACCVLRFQPAEPQRAGNLDRALDDAVVDHHDSDGGPGDDVDVVADRLRPDFLGDVEPGIAGDDIGDVLLRDADQDDWLVVLHQLRPGDHAVPVDTDENVDRLAGIADRACEVRIQKDPADFFAIAQSRGHRQVSPDLAKTVGARHDFARFDLVEKAANCWIGGLGER